MHLAKMIVPAAYSEARRVFWIMDNTSSHRGTQCVAPRQDKSPRVVPVHGSVHASWLKQIEIYFSIVQRKVLTPDDFPSLAALEERLLAVQDYYEAIARPSRGHSHAAISPTCFISSAPHRIHYSDSPHDEYVDGLMNHY